MKILKIIGIILLILILLVVIIILLLPWMDRWDTSDQERSDTFPGDELLPSPARVTNRGVTIQAPASKVYPWLLQLGADKSGMYSYTWLENLMGCTMAKDETLHPEWHDLKPGDLMKMCTSEKAPPPYVVAQVHPDQAVVLGHPEGDKWADIWTFNLIPQTDGSTRLVSRTSTNMTGGFWDVIRPIAFVMERKMLLTIKSLAETRP